MEEEVEILSEPEVVGNFKEISLLNTIGQIHVVNLENLYSMYKTPQKQARQIPT